MKLGIYAKTKRFTGMKMIMMNNCFIGYVLMNTDVDIINADVT